MDERMRSVSIRVFIVERYFTTRGKRSVSQVKTDRNKVVMELLNGTLDSIRNVVPIEFQLQRPKRVTNNFHLNFGVLIGITGDIQGKLVFTGQPVTFNSIGEKMFGMPLNDEMLLSFSGELGNMIAGGLSTTISQNGTNINITSPTIMQGNTSLTGFEQALEVTLGFADTGEVNTYLLID